MNRSIHAPSVKLGTTNEAFGPDGLTYRDSVISIDLSTRGRGPKRPITIDCGGPGSGIAGPH